MKKIVAVIVMFLVPSFVLFAVGTHHGFYEIRPVHVQSDKVSPKIPKTWRLVSVANGNTPNSNSLWFQDDDGSIFMISGFHDSTGFILNPNIAEIDGQ